MGNCYNAGMCERPTLVAPSILAGDFARVGEETRKVQLSGADWVHCDVMDGHFVDNISFGPAFVEAVAKNTNLPLDVHLMVSRPDVYFPRFDEAHSVSVHVEAAHDVAATLAGIRGAGQLAGLALNPATPWESVEPYFGQFDILLVMTVVPGFGGQAFMPDMLEKVRAVAAQRDERGLDFHIEVDGGVNVRTAALSRAAGANVMVAGTSFFRAANAADEVVALRSGDS